MACVDQGIDKRAFDPACRLHRHTGWLTGGEPAQQLDQSSRGVGEACDFLLGMSAGVEPFAADIYADPG